MFARIWKDMQFPYVNRKTSSRNGELTCQNLQIIHLCRRYYCYCLLANHSLQLQRRWAVRRGTRVCTFFPPKKILSSLTVTTTSILRRVLYLQFTFNCGFYCELMHFRCQCFFSVKSREEPFCNVFFFFVFGMIMALLTGHQTIFFSGQVQRGDEGGFWKICCCRDFCLVRHGHLNANSRLTA